MPQGRPARVIQSKPIQGLLGAMGLAVLPLLAGVALANTPSVPAVYATKAEAETAARKHFNCTGAHPMGHQWMPCAKHGQASGSAHSHH
jgi:hypothetical protein